VRVLALEREVPGVADAAFEPHLVAEAARVWELYVAGTLREIHFRADRDEAVLVLECRDADAARAALATLPLVRAGLIEFDVVPLRPYPGLARLFATSSRE
jgi:hypothetical protein